MFFFSGKGSGYYGCYNAKRKTCDNKLLISRKKIETLLINSLKEKFLTPENIEYVYRHLEKELAKSLNQVPEEMKKKKHLHDKIKIEIQNYLNFIKVGNFSKAVSDALNEAERKEDFIKQEIEALQHQRSHCYFFL